MFTFYALPSGSKSKGMVVNCYLVLEVKYLKMDNELAFVLSRSGRTWAWCASGDVVPHFQEDFITQ